MKLFLLTLLTICHLTKASSQNYIPNDTLFVVSINGLILREAPSQKSSINTVLQNGEKVAILELNGPTLDSIDGLHGHWVKIHSITSNSYGYVFDAFISHYPVLTRFDCIKDFVSGKYMWTDDEMFDFLPKLLQEYANTVFKPIGCQMSYRNGSDGEGAFSLDIQDLNGDMRLIKHGYSEGHGIELEFSNARFSEVYYVILNILKFVPVELSKIDENDMKKLIHYGQRCIRFSDKGCIIRFIFKGDNKMSILFNNACC